MKDPKAKMAKFFTVLGKNLLLDAWYPVVGIILAQALLNPEDSLADCFSNGFIVLSAIVGAAMFCFGLGWGLSDSERD